MVSDAVNIILYSFVVLSTVNIFYKLLVNQGQAKQIRENVENMNRQLREEQKNGNKEKSSQILSNIMREQGRVFKMSMKPLIVSFVIIGGFFYLIGGSYGNKIVELSSGMGTVTIDNQKYPIEKIDDKITINGKECPCVIGNSAWRIAAEGDKVTLVRIVTSLPVSLPLIGNETGFLGWYIIVSMPTMIILRKLMKIYT